MGEQDSKSGIFETSYIVILMSYSLLSVVLMVATVLLSWELWAVPFMAVSLIGCWLMHIFQRLTEYYRIWLYVIQMMMTFFYYGIHDSSFFDLAPLICVMMMIFAMTGKTVFVNLCSIIYYITMIYDLIGMLRSDYQFERLFVLRLIAHFALVLIALHIIHIIIRRWLQNVQSTSEQITYLTDTTRRMDNFLANVSHEIRTPVNAVIGLSEVLLKREKDETLQKDIRSIQDAGQRVAEQISDILDFTEIDMERLSVSNEVYMISSMVNDLIAELSRVGKRGCEVIFDIDTAMPLAFIGDENKVQKILWHLIGNGIKFTKKGCVYVHIYAISKPYGVNLCMDVEDTGIGMDEEELQMVYEKFYQSDSGRNRTAGGLGLGMSIVYGFVKEMGGFLTIESEKNVGTHVHVSIPQGVSEETECVSVHKPERLCIATFFQFNNFDAPQAREYYTRTIVGMVRGLGLTTYQVTQWTEFRRLQKQYHLTHLFLGADEYERYAEEVEELTEWMEVILVAGEEFELPENSAVKLIRKPFSCFPFAQIINNASGIIKESEEGQMYCKGMHVLVADDEPMNLMVAEGIFKGYGMSVTTAASGMEALELCKVENYDLIFMDHMMPGMDGVETMRRLRTLERERERPFNIVALTANAVSSAKDMFLSEGFDGFVPKPIEIAELERVIKKLLPRSAITYRKSEETKEPVKRSKKEKKAKRQEKQRREEETGKTEKKKDTGEDTEQKLPGFFKKLDKEGIRTAAGLGYCRNDAQFYQMLLMQFSSDAERKRKELQKLFEEKDWHNYMINVHALKSTAKMIGADELSELARKLERAAEKQTVLEILTGHGKMMSLYIQNASAIQEILGNDKKNEMEELPEKEITKEELERFLGELSDSFLTFEAEKAEQLLTELSGFQYQKRSLAEVLSEIRNLVSEFDLEAAEQKLPEVRDILLGGEGK